MPNLTENYGLKKPLPEEFYDINVQNENMDIIDEALKTHTHEVGDITGTLPISKGGTGSTSATAALANLGAAKSSHKHGATDINSGTLSSDRLPTIPIKKGGTGKSSFGYGTFLVGNGTSALTERTPAEVVTDIGALPATEDPTYKGCYYCMNDDVQEWINPPLRHGVEYRTTERYDGKPVYVKVINYGALATSGTTVNIPLGCTATNLVYFDILTTLFSGNQYNFPTFDYTSANALLTGYFINEKTAFLVKCHADLSSATAVVTVKYTKD